jgi:hypothetical protein
MPCRGLQDAGLALKAMLYFLVFVSPGLLSGLTNSARFP